MPAFDTDFAVADAMLAEAFGGAVTYHRGATVTASITAESITQDYEIIDVDGIVTIARVRDYAIAIADLVISGSTITPRGGDRIKESIGGATHVHEVMPLGRRPCYEWAGAQKPQWLIHTKFVGTE